MSYQRPNMRSAHPVSDSDGFGANREVKGVRIELGKRKQIKLHSEGPGWTFFVQSGVLTVDALLPGERRQVMLILYPGESISRDTAPPLPNVVLTAMTNSVLLRTPSAATDGPAFRQPILHLMARSSVHGLMIGRLTSEERLCSFLIELALFLGVPAAGGYTCELPLTRADMADYLALNPDTLSRLLTRLRLRNIISLPSRSRVIIKDMAMLTEMSPIAEVLRQLHAGSRSLSLQAARPSPP